MKITLQISSRKLNWYPWVSPQDYLAAARQLIERCGNGHRDEELADAKKAIFGS